MEKLFLVCCKHKIVGNTYCAFAIEAEFNDRHNMSHTRFQVTETFGINKDIQFKAMQFSFSISKSFQEMRLVMEHLRMFFNNMPPPLICKIELISISVGYEFFHRNIRASVNTLNLYKKV